MRLFVVALLCLVLPSVLCVPRSKRVLQKRGIYGYGGLHGIGAPYGGAYSYGLPASYPLSPYGYGKPYHSSVYSKLPAILNNPHHPEVNYALTHGDASVTSFNVNYPRYPYIHAKPLHPVIAPQVPIAAPSFILPEKPIIPVAVSSGVSHQHHFIPQFLPSGLVPAVAPPPQPINPFYQYAIQPQYVTVQLPFAENAAPTLPPTTTTVVVPTQQSTPEPTFIPIAVAGTNFNTDIKPDEQPWRPIINEANPTSATSVNRPSISLLPPYGLPSTPSTPFITGNENPQGTFFTGSTLPAPIDVNQNTFRPTDFSFNQNTNPTPEYPQQRPEYLPPQRPDFQNERPGIQGQGSFNQVGGVTPANDNNYNQDNDNGNFGFNQNQNPGFNPAQEYPQQRPEYLPPTNPGIQGQGTFNQPSGVSPSHGNNFNQHTGNGNFIPNFNNNNNNNNNGNDQGFNGPRYLAPTPQTTGLANLSLGQNLGGGGGGGVVGRNNGHHKKQRKHSNRNKNSNGGLTIRVRQGSRDLY